MCSRHAPENGADSEWVLRPYRCLIRDTEGPTWWIYVNAMGPNDAKGLAAEKARDQGADEPAAVKVEELQCNCEVPGLTAGLTCPVPGHTTVAA